MSFGETLAKLRKDAKMSQEDLASVLNVSRQSVSKWESNNAYPETEKILAICKLFNVSMDELMGLKDKKKINDNTLLSKINSWCDNFIKSIQMFFSLSFKNKLLCLLEMSLYLFLIIIFLIIFNYIFSNILFSVIDILPHDLGGLIISIFKGILLAFYFITIIFILIKIFKIRYLDYYDKYYKEKEFEETNKDLKEKIIIRDSKTFNPFSYLYKIYLLTIKIIAIIGLIFIAFIFVLLCTILMFDLYFIKYGILLFYIALIICGAIIICYVLLELIIKLVFNLKFNSKKLYIMFIGSLIVIGISIGLSICELLSYELVEKDYIYKVDDIIVPMQNNLIIDEMDEENTVINITNRDDILIEFYAPLEVNATINTNNYSVRGYLIQKNYLSLYVNDNLLKDYLDSFLKQVKTKTLSIDFNTQSWYKTKISLSEENYQKLLKNEKDFITR